MVSTRIQFRLILFTSLIALLSFIIFILLRFITPFDGARLEPGQQAISADGVNITPLTNLNNGLLKGDRIIAVEDQSIEEWFTNRVKSQNLFSDQMKNSTIKYTVRRGNEIFDLNIQLSRYPFSLVIRKNWGTILFASVYLIVGGFVFFRRSKNESGWIFCLSAACVTSSTAWSFGLQVSDFVNPTGFWIYKICTLFFYNLFWTSNLHFALIFPKPMAFIERRPKWFFPLIYIGPFIIFAGYISVLFNRSENLLDWVSKWSIAESLHPAVFLTMIIIALIFQFLRASERIARKQIQWVILAGLIAAGGGLFSYILPPLFGLKPVGPNIMALIVMPFPVAIALAILRYNLFNIDKLIRRTLVYGILTIITMAIYILIVGVLTNELLKDAEPFVAFLTTGLVAIIFQPLRVWLQGWVNRLMYGERDDPIKVLSGLAKVLEQAGSPEDALKRITETVARALKLPYVAIELNNELEPVASFGLPKGRLIRVPMLYENETNGFLVVAERSDGEEFNPSDLKVLENIAHQAGTSAHATKLTTNLLLSRQKLVTTREEERRRIRRDLHDGLGPTLASLAMRMDIIRNLIRSDPEASEQLLNDLKKQTQNTIQDVRRLVYDLRPPALDEFGLIGALKNFLEGNSEKVPVLNFSVQENLPPLSAAVEAAAYRIVLEGFNNIIKHAHAVRVSIDIHCVKDDLIIEIEDDGVGMASESSKGVGLISMKERAEELGGKFEILPGMQGFHFKAYLPINGRGIQWVN